MVLPWSLSVAFVLTLFAPLTFANTKQKESETLIEHARQLSNIRAIGAPAFRLTVTLRVTDQDAHFEGTFTETWVSPEQWRREIVAKTYHSVTIAQGRKLWIFESDSVLPSPVGAIRVATDFSFSLPDNWKSEKVEGRLIQGIAVQCIVSQSNAFGGKSALCFAKDNGLLVERIDPRRLDSKVVDNACVFSHYQEFGGRMFPRSVDCFLDQRPVWNADLQLVGEPSPDPAMFVPPANAKESTNCMGAVFPPKATYSPDPELPRRENPSHPVVLTVLVGIDGKPHEIRVARSIDNAFDNAALNAVRRWRFKPATCDGQPIETRINVEVEFRAW